jgi:hypothetical protein
MADWKLGDVWAEHGFTAEKTPTAASRLGGVGVFPLIDFELLCCFA